MKKHTVYALIALVCLLAFWLLAFPFAAMSLMLGLMLGYLFSLWVEKLEHRNHLTTTIDHLYIISQHPQTGEKVQFPEHYQHHVVHAPYRLVDKAKRKMEAQLRKYGNTYFCDSRVPLTRRIQVKKTIFGDGEYYGELWGDFCERATREVAHDLSKHRKQLKADNSEWFDQHANSQHGVNFTVDRK